jgi:hypothetical protein
MFPLLDDSKKVHLVTGERWTPPKARALRERHREDAEREVPKVAAAKRIVGYLNSLKSNLFAAKVNANVGNAIAVAGKIDDRRRRRIELTKLHRISIQPQPFYGPPVDAHTVRVFAKNVSIPMLKNEVKGSLIDGWTTFDLKSAQFAIVAKDWGITELHTELTKGIDIWKTLTDLYSTLDAVRVKPLLKTAVYSICYGMSRDNVISELKNGFVELGCSAFDAFPLTRTLYQRRNNRLSQGFNSVDDSTIIIEGGSKMPTIVNIVPGGNSSAVFRMISISGCSFANSSTPERERKNSGPSSSE